MNIDIRKSIIANFKDSDHSEINSSIEEAVQDKDEVTLPGLGVFFEILWNHSSKEEQNQIVNTIKKGLSTR